MKLLLALAVAVAMLGITSAPAYALDADPPSTLSEVHGFQCLITENAASANDCDMLIVIRYQLGMPMPMSATPTSLTWRVV